MKQHSYLLFASIVAGCTALFVPTSTAEPPFFEVRVSPNADHFPQNKQNESPMAVNPVDPLNAISGANDEIEEPDCGLDPSGGSDCPFAPDVNVTGVYTTVDGGFTWHKQILHWNDFGLISDGDPVVCFGPRPDGIGHFSYGNGARAYFGCLAHGLNAPASQELLAVVYSDDNGLTWSRPVIATTRNNPVDFNDKIAIWADATSTSSFFGKVYVSWTLFVGNPLAYFGKSSAFSPEPIMIASSSDGATTFSAPRQLSSAQDNGFAGGRQGSVIRSGNDGTVYVFWDGTWSKQEAIVGVASTDGGRSFGKAFLVGKVSSLNEVPGASFRVDSFPTAAVDAAGNLFVAWTDVVAGQGVITLAKSSNHGAAWTLKQAAAVTRRTAFYPGLAAWGTKVFIGFNAIDDVPEGTPAGAGVVKYDAYYVLSSDGGNSFAAPVKVSARASDPDSATSNALVDQFLGDYNGAAAGPDGSFWFSWTDTRDGAPCEAVDLFRLGGARPVLATSCSPAFGNSDIYVARIK